MLVPPSEALDWDLRDEVASTARYWMAEREAWWVAAPYASTAVSIASRFNGGRAPLEELASPSANGRRRIALLPPPGLQRLLRRVRARLRTRWVSARIWAARWGR